MSLRKRSSLHNAVVEEQIEVVSELIEKGDELNTKDDKGITPLHLAVKTKNISIIKLLLDAGADAHANIGNESDEKSSPMYMAIESNDVDIIKCFLESIGDVNAKDEEGCTPLHLAAIWGNSKTLKLLLDAGAHVNAIDDCERTPLIKSCETTDNIKILKLLIDAGADVNAREESGYSALHWAVESRNVNIPKLLIDAGANVNVKSDTNVTPIHEAAEYGCSDVFKLLIDSGGDVNVKDDINNTPLLRAARAKNFNIIETVINCGANVRAVNNSGYTALHYATESQFKVDVHSLKLLIDAGANVNAKDFGDRSTPLHNAAQIRNPDILQLLISSGSNANEYNAQGDTPLSLFIKNIKWKQESEDKNSISKGLRLLLECTDINLPDKFGNNIINDILQSENLLGERKFFYKPVLKHIAVLKVLSLPVHKGLLNMIFQNKGYKDYFATCTQELEKAKSTRLENCWVTYLNLLVDNKIKLVRYAGNTNLIKDFVKSMHNFPIYSTNMQSNISEGIIARELFDGAANNLSYYLPIFDSFHLIIRDILNSLSEKDWEKLFKKKRFCE